MKPPSPLFVWKLLLIVVVSTGASLYFADPMKVVFEKRDRKLLTRIKDIHFSGDQIGIIFFGNSLMNTALPAQEIGLNSQLSNEFRKAGISKPISAIEVTGGGIKLSDLHSLADELIAIRPSVVVIQSEMLVPRGRMKGSKQPPPPLVERIGIWSGLLKLQLFGRRSQPEVAKPSEQKRLGIEKDVRTARERRKAAAQQRMAQPMEIAKQMWENQVVSTKHPELIAGRELIARLTSLGIRVVIVELPVSETALSLSSQEYFKERSRTIQSVLRPGVIHSIYPDVLPDQYFLDYSHFRPKGRDQFVEWFFPALAQELAKNERN